ncbi:hypothetical protein, partial [uncultured Rikenella sp.]
RLGYYAQLFSALRRKTTARRTNREVGCRQREDASASVESFFGSFCEQKEQLNTVAKSGNTNKLYFEFMLRSVVG